MSNLVKHPPECTRVQPQGTVATSLTEIDHLALSNAAMETNNTMGYSEGRGEGRGGGRIFGKKLREYDTDIPQESHKICAQIYNLFFVENFAKEYT